MRAKPALRYYGWCIVGVALVAQLVQVGTQVYATGIFLKPMSDELGWSRESFSAVQTLSTVVMGGLGLFIGTAVDRRGPRSLMLVGGVIAGASLVATAFVHTLWEFYLARGVAQTVGMALFGSLVVNVTVARWFVARRGMAIALASVGISLGGVLMVPLVSWWVGDYGWRTAWVLQGILVWVVVLPAALLMRRAPEDFGQMPDGMSEDEAAAYTAATKRVSAASEVQWTRAEAVRTRALWMIICGYGVGMMGSIGLLLHAVPMLADAGFDRGTAAALYSMWAWMALVAKLFWGAVMDRFHPRYLSAISFLSGAIGLAALAPAVQTGSVPLVALGFAAIGFSFGGSAPMQETVWAGYFGRAHLGEIRSIAMPFSIIFSAGGPLLGGILYDRTGDYGMALLIFAAFTALGALLVLLARPPELPPRAEPATGPSPRREQRAVRAEPADVTT